jgi:hypothetical protein
VTLYVVRLGIVTFHWLICPLLPACMRINRERDPPLSQVVTGDHSREQVVWIEVLDLQFCFRSKNIPTFIQSKKAGPNTGFQNPFFTFPSLNATRPPFCFATTYIHLGRSATIWRYDYDTEATTGK